MTTAITTLTITIAKALIQIKKCQLFISDDCQYGFRENRSTSMELMALTEESTDCMDKRTFAIGVFLDLKKAFDTINRDILLKKLERYGIRWVALNWLISYIGQRKQFVELDNQKSDLQMSHMSPIFLI